MEPERPVQPQFRKGALAGGLLLIAAIAAFDRWMPPSPNRVELGWRTARIEVSPVELDPRGFAPLRLAAAWQLSSPDPRFGGVSALAVDRGRLLALTDSGVLIRFAPPAGGAAEARIGELPDGPGSGRFKRNRDTEALVRDPLGGGWWAPFENRDELWLFDPGFRRAVQRIHLGDRNWRRNRGVEAAVADGPALLLLTESGDSLIRIVGTRARSVPIANARGRIADAAALEPGRWLAVERRPTLLGFHNALVILEKAGDGYRFGGRIPLPLGRLDNVEALAVENLGAGRRRLWLMTDDNFQPPLRILLVALDLPLLPAAPDEPVRR